MFPSEVEETGGTPKTTIVETMMNGAYQMPRHLVCILCEHSEPIISAHYLGHTSCEHTTVISHTNPSDS